MTEIADRFFEVYGTTPDGVWSAPGRVNLIGEHTDYNQGLVLPFAIDRRTTCAARLNGTGVLRASSTAQEGIVEVSLEGIATATFEGWSGYALGIAWAMQNLGWDVSDKPGVDFLLDSNVPLGAGLSSSAAIESAIIAALNELWSLNLSQMDMARIGQKAENGAVGAPTGIMDQVASVFGRAGYAVRLDCQSMQAELVPLPLDEQGLSLLVIDTHVKHSHANGGYAERRAACEAGAAAMGVESLRGISADMLDEVAARVDAITLKRVRHVVTENDRVIEASQQLAESGPRAIGDLMVASHVSMRDDFEISVPQIDTAVETAMAHGAIGARLTGGGFGGAAIALVDNAKADAIIAAIEAAFAAHGFEAPTVISVVPSDGPRREA